MVQELGLNEEVIQDRLDFDLQIKKPFSQHFKTAFVLGIVDNVPNKSVVEEVDNTGVADAAFLSESLCMLIEVKIRRYKLSVEQIKRHENLFVKGQLILPPVYRTWDQMIQFFNRQRNELKGEKHIITKFLIDQFLGFCGINGLGEKKSKQYYFQCFPLSIRQLAREIDLYIVEKYVQEIDTNRPSRSNGISYTRKKRRGFFAKLETVDHILILSFEGRNGNAVQNELAALGISKNRKTGGKAFVTPEREAWIDLHKINSLKQIKLFIDKAFNERP
ncbi:hypothetical protein C4A76_23805 [Brevibacillus laterosporus]|uniref:hypothetical protein n=1 Tax=Brevibacillus laterosporus TaxID=1465 RepID=UPI000CE32152|nr:hypothetical protein [Brevibacillus laterosporus]PPA81289.1 hypothetical protein C4A76_23805 [Brevibacillus laterosporus]